MRGYLLPVTGPNRPPRRRCLVLLLSFPGLLGWLPDATSYVLFVGLLCPPVGVAVAVLRYRLWDLDRLVSRTVTYTLAMGAWLRRQRHWLVAEPLPGYAPDLNPVEALWFSLKGVELANLAGDTLDDVTAAAERGIQRIRDTHHLAYSFLRHCGLSLW
jgi:hypothetical protein